MSEIKILHLSDLHYDSSKPDDTQIILDAFLQDLDNFKDIDFIVFSGDLVKAGDKKDDFEKAFQTFIRPLLRKTNLNEDKFFIAPGNHDIQISKIKKVIESGLQKILKDRESVNEFIDEEIENNFENIERLDYFNDFKTKFNLGHVGKPNKLFSTYVAEKENVKIGIACLNSCWRATGAPNDGDRGKLLIGERQIDAALKNLIDCNIKIAIFHHPLDCLTEYDQSDAEDKVSSEFDFLFCGHLHNAKLKLVQNFENKTFLIQGGCLNKGRKHYNCYSVLCYDVQKRSGTIYYRTYFDKRKVFDKSYDICKNGEFPISIGIIESHENEAQKPPQYINFPFTHNHNPFFVGQENVFNQIAERLKKENLVILSGLGGIGKTSIATEFAGRNPEQYKAILWMSSNSEDSERYLKSSFDEVARCLNIEQNNTELNIKSVQKWLRDNKNWILIVDDLGDQQVIEKYFTSDMTGHILMTTRTSIPGSISIDLLPIEECTRFLIERSESAENQDNLLYAKSICEELGRLPLALEQAGVYIAQNKCGLLGYLTTYREESNERSEILRTNPGPFFLHKETVVATWTLSFRKIRESQPAALEMLRLCAFLHVEIPEELIKEAAKYCGEEIQVVVKSFSRFNAALRKILDYSLIKRSPDTKQLTIHKLVQEVLRMEMNENEKLEYIKKMVKALNNVFTETDFTGWEICNRIINHVQVVLQFIKEMKINIPESAQLMNKAGVYLFNRARFNEAEDIFRSILSGNIDTTSSEIAHASCNLAELLEETGHYNEGIELAGKALEIFAKLNGAASLEYANCNRVLGLIYESKGDFEKSVPLFMAALDVRSKIFGEEDIRVAVIHNNLGKIFCSIGDYEKAIFYHQKAKSIRESKLPPNHPDLAQTYNNIANIFIKIGKYEIAEDLYKRARSIWENAYIDENKSKKHPDIAIAYNHLALCQLHQKKYEEAEGYLKEAVSILKSFGFEHPHLPTTWNNWGVIYHEKGDYEKAIQYYQKAYSLFETLFGDMHLGLIEILTNLGSVFLLQKNYMKAKDIFQQQLKIQEKYFGKEHPAVLETMRCLSSIYKEVGDVDEGERLFEEALSIAKKIYGDNAEYVVRMSKINLK